MDDFVSASGNGENLGEGEDFTSGIDTSGPSYSGTGTEEETFFSQSVMDDLEAEVHGAETAPKPGEEPPQPKPKITDADKTQAYAAIILQMTSMIVVPLGAPAPKMPDCTALAKAVVETEKFFPTVNPVEPKWMAVLSLGMASFSFYQLQREAIRAANAKDVTPQPQAAPVEAAPEIEI